MTTKKKDLEIVCNLQWKNKPTTTGDKSNIVGIYDIPATTLNWDIFKSYLLKNSGTTGDDVKVYYVDSEKKEIAINSQMDFQIALYFIRQQARLGEIITLVLDRVSDVRKGARPKRVKQSDVQTQASSSEMEDDEPPEWFLKFMNKFKKKIVEEVTTIINTNVKTNQTCVHTARKSRSETKRGKKTTDLSNEREIKKMLKLERKLENKLEKLEHKTLKVKAKKLALGRPYETDSVARNNFKSRPVGVPLTDEDYLMDARPLNNMNTTIPHMNGGETYKHSWEVINSGKLPWTSETELRYAWGSQALTPVDKRMPCLTLKPGEKGLVSVYLNIPETPGNYECYWHFHHNGRRFGHWLGCHIIVDEPPAKNHKYDIVNIGENYELLLPTTWTVNLKKEDKRMAKESDFEGIEQDLEFNCTVTKKSVNVEKDEEINESMKKLDISGSDSDNQSIVSIADSNVSTSSNEQFVMVPVDNTDTKNDEEPIIKPEKDEDSNVNIAADALSELAITTDSNETKSETNATIDSCEETKENLEALDSEYAYIYFDGKKIPMLKKFLRPDYLATAEEAIPPNKSTHSQTDNLEAKTNNNDKNRRLFVFPQNCPGFEVVYPSLEAENETNWFYNQSCDNSLESANYFVNAQRDEDSLPSSRVTSPCSHHRIPQQTQNRCQCEQPYPPQSPHLYKVLNGAATIASSAMSAARNALNMVSGKEVGRWENGRWISTNATSKREMALKALEEMGFWDRNLNATLLGRHNDDLSLVVTDLLQSP